MFFGPGSEPEQKTDRCVVALRNETIVSWFFYGMVGVSDIHLVFLWMPRLLTDAS